MATCCIYNCISSYRRMLKQGRRDITFHRRPDNENTKRVWIQRYLLSKEVILGIIRKVQEAGLNVVSSTSDLATTNRGLLNELGGITEEKPYFLNPVTNEPIVVFADLPHLAKLLRNNLFDHGFKLSNGRSTSSFTILTVKRDFQELMAKNRTEFKTCFKLTQAHLDVSGRQRMNVRMAFETLSNTVSKAFEKYLPWKRHIADFLSMVNKASDILNSRYPESKNIYKTGYGAHLSEQNEVLEAFAKEIRQMRPLDGQGQPMPSKLPFQKGFLITIASLKLLYKQMNKSGFKTKYILTARLNQDFIENMFGSIRGLGMFNPNPSPTECMYRLKALVISKCFSSPKSSSVAPNSENNNHFNSEILTYLKENEDNYSIERKWASALAFAESLFEIDMYEPNIEEINEENWKTLWRI